MSIVHKRTHYLVPANHYQEGLGLRFLSKLFGGAGKWLKKGLHVAIDMVGGALKTAAPWASKWIQDGMTFLHEQVDEIDLSLTQSKSLISPELTASEEAKLDAWLEKFKIYSGNLATEAGNATNLAPEAQISAINAVLNKINSVQDHYAVATEAGLSDKALEQRRYLIFEAFKLIHDTVIRSVDKLKSQGQNISKVTVTFPISNYSFSPLFTSTIVTTVTGENFKLNSKLPSGDTPVITTPVKDPATGGIVPTTGTTTTPAKKTNTKLIVAGIGAAALAVAIFSGSGSSGTKKTGKPSGSTRRTAKRKK